MDDKALHIKLPAELYDALQETANRKNISFVSMIRILCSEGLERENVLPEATVKDI